jgi:hypothetical protein
MTPAPASQKRSADFSSIFFMLNITDSENEPSEPEPLIATAQALPLMLWLYFCNTSFKQYCVFRAGAASFCRSRCSRPHRAHTAPTLILIWDLIIKMAQNESNYSSVLRSRIILTAPSPKMMFRKDLFLKILQALHYKDLLQICQS